MIMIIKSIIIRRWVNCRVIFHFVSISLLWEVVLMVMEVIHWQRWVLVTRQHSIIHLDLSRRKCWGSWDSSNCWIECKILVYLERPLFRDVLLMIRLWRMPWSLGLLRVGRARAARRKIDFVEFIVNLGREESGFGVWGMGKVGCYW